MSLRGVLFPATIAAALVAAVPAALAQTAQPKPAPAAPAVTVVRAAPAELAETVFVTGTVTPRDDVLVGPEIDGYRIVELLADEGDRVRAGQTLARLSRETLDIMLLQNAASLARIDASIDQAKAQIAQSEADLSFATATLGRSRQLDRSGFASKEVLDQKVATENAARARLAASKEGLALAMADRRQMEAQRKDTELKIARTEIRSPVDGVVSRRTAKVGMIAAGAQEALFRIIRDGVVEVEADVSETILARLKAGQQRPPAPTRRSPAPCASCRRRSTARPGSGACASRWTPRRCRPSAPSRARPSRSRARRRSPCRSRPCSSAASAARFRSSPMASSKPAQSGLASRRMAGSRSKADCARARK